MANTPKNLTPKPRAVAAAGPAATVVHPPQAPQVLQQLTPPPAPEPEPEQPAPAPTAEEADEIAAIAARRRNAPKSGGLKMYVPPRVGWVRRWFTDIPGRIALKQQQGWNFVKHPETGENWMMVVENSLTEAGGRKGYVMEIPLQFYSEDQSAKQKSLDEVDAKIYGGTYNAEPDDKRYVPESTPIRVDTRTGRGSG